jgi:hypothetical protein
MRDESDARWQQFRPCRLDLDRRSVWAMKAHPMVGGWLVPVFELSLGDGGAEGDVPQGRRFGLVRLTTGEVAHKSQLRCALRL